MGNIFRYFFPEKSELASSIRRITGVQPHNITIYKIALTHASRFQKRNDKVMLSNERLEYLGDAILGAIIANYLYHKFPNKDEGFLTEIRSRIVNRERLNTLAKKLGLDALVEVDKNAKISQFKSVYGNALEAIVGAIYLDRGYKVCRKFVVNSLLAYHMDIDEIVNNNSNYKSLLIEWAQKNDYNIYFEITNETIIDNRAQFTSSLSLNGEIIAEGKGPSKKKAEQSAARKACEISDLL